MRRFAQPILFLAGAALTISLFGCNALVGTFRENINSPVPHDAAPVQPAVDQQNQAVQANDIPSSRSDPSLDEETLAVMLQRPVAEQQRPILPTARPFPRIGESFIITRSLPLLATPTISSSEPATGALALLPTVTPTPDLIVLPSPTPDDNQSETGGDVDEPTGVLDANVVNVRRGPGTNYAVVGQVRLGAVFGIIGRNETASWLQICCPLDEVEQSWISAQFVNVVMPTGDTMVAVPTAIAPPTPTPGPVVVAPSGGQSSAALAAAPAPGLPGDGGFGAPGGSNPLTGLPFSSGGQRPVIVCINNDYAARPQFGTSQADVVYEYLMEGYGITRFSAIYYGQDSGQIGPVRSARLINYYMGALYNAGLVCSGASDAVRYTLKHESPFPYMDIDLDDPSNARYSVSIGSDYRTRLRTATDKLDRWLADWGVQQAGSIRGFTFGAAPGSGVPATSISIPYPSGTGSQVAYRYDGSRYLRSMGGGAHVDGNTGTQLALENVIVQYVPHQATNIVEDSLGSTSIRLNLFGSGKAIVFRDGQAFEGTWRSESRGDMPRFFDQNGAEIPLKPGKSWISIVPMRYTIGFQ